MKKIGGIIVLVLLLSAFLAGYAGAAGGAGEDGIQALYPASVVTADGDRWGYIDATGTFVLQPNFDLAGDFNEKGVAVTAMIPEGETRYGTCTVLFIDRSGKSVAGPFQAPVPDFDKGYAVIREGKGSKVIGEDGRIRLETNYDILSIDDEIVVFTDKKLYGHMDLQGNVLVPPRYKYAYRFMGGKAVVSLPDDGYAVIDPKGKILQTSENYLSVPKASEGLVAYRDEELQKFGYKDLAGEVVIQPRYEEAGEFTGGYAVVNLPEERYQNKYGLIDKKGGLVIENAYSGIHYLGNGRYSVSMNAFSPWHDRLVPKAIFNTGGERLTDFKYYDIGSFTEGIAVVTTDDETFFVDLEGREVSDLPRLKGIGTMEIRGEIVKAVIDGNLSYRSRKGEVIWQQEKAVLLEGSLTVKTAKYRPDIAMLITYPVLQDLPDLKLQEEINDRLKQLFTAGREKSETFEGMYSRSIEEGFSASRNNDLLIIERTGYDYPIGAAHGMPYRTYYHIDLKTGAFYRLSDLFRKESGYADLLTSLVRKQVELNTRMKLESGGYYYFTQTPEVSADHDFIVGKDALEIYYYPYDISAYAAGFPSFEIPYGQLADCIDTEGGFWSAFDKDILQSKINILDGVGADAAREIEARMESYERNRTDAVNRKDFSIVEHDLLPGSALYREQQSLADGLSQDIKEKLLRYDIYAIAYEYARKEYKVFVTGETAAGGSDREAAGQSLRWCYTLKPDENGKLRLCDRESW